MGTLELQSNGPLFSNTVTGTLELMGRQIHLFWYSEEATGQAVAL